jgi:hypothetical protein
VRAAAHVHSAWSDDASWSLSRIATAFGRLRYRVVLMSEHSRGFSAAKWQEYTQACAQASTSRVTLIPGIEYGDEDDVVHIPVWGRVPFFGEAPGITALLGDVTVTGGTAVWAHPWRRDAWRRFDPSWRQHLSGIEVWNRKYDGIAPNRRSVELAEQHGARPFVALDFHTRRQLFPLSLAVGVERGVDGAPAGAGTGEQAVTPEGVTPEGVTPEGVYAALSAGRFSARAFGLPLTPMSSGLPATTLRMLESGRRVVARLAG